MTKATKTETTGVKVVKASILDACVQVLKGHKPMHTKAIAEALAARKLWATDSKKTPVTTIIVSSISGEIHKKGKKARFVKTAPATYRLNKAA